DDVARAREPLLERRDHRHAAGDDEAVLRRLQLRHRILDRRRAVVVEVVHPLFLPYSAASGVAAACIACQTRCGVAGMSSRSTPRGRSASITAFMTAAGAAIAPASPHPFTPSGLCGQGVSCVMTVKDGRSSARGMQ